MFSTVSNFWRRFGGDRRGNVAMILALSLIGLVGTAGVGIDFYKALAAKSRLDLASDAAAIAAINAAQSYIAANSGDANRSGAYQWGHSRRSGAGPESLQFQCRLNRQHGVHSDNNHVPLWADIQRDGYLSGGIPKFLWPNLRQLVIEPDDGQISRLLSVA
jgi:Putative Flp pilus-assembly TadE/G-like